METIKQEHRALPKGSTILVTGVSGYIGSHVVKEALDAGYKVIGTSRSKDKAESTKKIFNSPDYSTAVIEDFQQEGILDDVVKRVDAIIHVASDTSFDSDPNKVITGTVENILSVLRSAAKSPSVKRLVLTSSSTAVYTKPVSKAVVFTANDWNAEAIEQAWAPPPYSPDRAYAVYAASKTEGEKALWKFVQEEKPDFIVNTVLPSFNMGRILPGGNGGVTGVGVPTIYKGEVPFIPGQYLIDVVDCGRIHVIAAAMDPSLNNERIFAFNVPFTWAEIIDIVKELYPDVDHIAKPPENEIRDMANVPNELGAGLLREWYGQESGWKPIKQSVMENLEGQV